MYESPINVLISAMRTELEADLVCKVSQAAGYEIDSQELARALRYDRAQYDKGYKDGQADAREVKELLKELYQTIDARKSYECAGCVYEHADSRTRYLNCTNFNCYRWVKADQVEKLLGVDG